MGLLSLFKKKEFRNYETQIPEIITGSKNVFNLLSNRSPENINELRKQVAKLVENVEAFNWALQPLRDATGSTAGTASTRESFDKIDKGLAPVNEILNIADGLLRDVMSLRKLVLELSNENLDDATSARMILNYRRGGDVKYFAAEHYKRAVETIKQKCSVPKIDKYFTYEKKIR